MRARTRGARLELFPFNRLALRPADGTAGDDGGSRGRGTPPGARRVDRGRARGGVEGGERGAATRTAAPKAEAEAPI